MGSQYAYDLHSIAYLQAGKLLTGNAVAIDGHAIHIQSEGDILIAAAIVRTTLQLMSLLSVKLNDAVFNPLP